MDTVCSSVAEEAGARMARESQPWTLMTGQDRDSVEGVAGFIEVSASSIMTAKSKELKRMFLPSTRTLTSLSGTLWWESRIGVRRKRGFLEIPERAFGSSKSAPGMPFADVEGEVASADNVL